MDHNHAKRLAAKKALKYLPVEFNENQIESISRGLATAVQEIGLCVFSCAIMPDHVHFVYALHKRKNGSLVGQLKSRATKQLNIESCHPFGGEATPWAHGHWEIYLDTEDEVFHAIEYVNQNPIREGNKPQSWPFVIPVD